MPHFHLHLHNAHVDVSDTEGTDATDLDGARNIAVSGIRDFLAHEVMHGQLDLRGQVDIADQEGRVLASILFKDAVSIIA